MPVKSAEAQTGVGPKRNISITKDATSRLASVTPPEDSKVRAGVDDPRFCPRPLSFGVPTTEFTRIYSKISQT